MILLSLENRQDVALCGRGKRVRDRTHLKGHLTAGRFRQENDAEREVRTVAMWFGAVPMLGDICIGITGEPSTITKCGGRMGTNPTRPVGAGSINYIGGVAGAWPSRVKQ